MSTVWPSSELVIGPVSTLLSSVDSCYCKSEATKYLTMSEFTQTTNINNNPTNPTLLGNATSHTHDVTRFTTEGHINEVHKTTDIVAVDQLNNVNDPRFHQIGDFLRRPYKIPNIEVWDQTKHPTYSTIFEVYVEDILKEMVTKYKLDGFYGFKGTAKLQVLINAQPFNTGLLQLAYLPIFDQTDNEYLVAGFYPSNGISNYGQAVYESGCPSVLANVGSTSEIMLEVPYIGGQAIMPIEDGKYGKFVLRSLATINDSTNAAKVSISAYMSFENVQCYAVSPFTFGLRRELQMDSQLITLLKSLLASQAEKTPESAPSTPASAPSQTEEAKANETSGPVSGIADTVGNIANTLTAIPGVSDIAGPVSWISKGVSSVAKMFGYSKPHSDKAAEAMWINPFKEFPMCEGNDHSTKLTVTPHQEVKIRPLGPCEQDEMSLTHILERPTFLSSHDWNEGMKAGTTVFIKTIHPSSLLATTGKYGDHDVESHSYLSYLSKIFGYWTGTIRITVTIVGNKFYSGRLRFVYVPQAPIYIEDKNVQKFIFNNMQHTYSHIVDVRDSNTFTIDCGYIASTPFKSVDEYSKENVLLCFVEQQLARPDTVNANLRIVTHVSALEDFTFAGPRSTPVVPAGGYLEIKPKTQMDRQLSQDSGYFSDPLDSYYGCGIEECCPRLTLQGFTNPLNTENTPMNISIANDHTKVSPHKALEQTIGDPVTSLRQVVKRFYKNVTTSWDSVSLAIQPYKLTEVQDFKSKDTQHPGDMIDYVSALYRFRTGGLRMAFSGLPEDETLEFYYGRLEDMKAAGLEFENNINWNTPTVANKVKWTDETLNFISHYLILPHRNDLQGLLQVEVPYYSEFPIIENTKFRYYTKSDTDVRDDRKQILIDRNLTTSNVLVINRQSDSKTRVSTYRAAADDFNCGFLLGPPPTIKVK